MTHWSSFIQCELQIHDLETTPEYQALSYEWGPPDHKRCILINGSSFRIRQNLWQFLDMFRGSDHNTGFLWIDQLCIDQSDDLERNHQVQMMSEIYSSAARVIAWLGPNDYVRLSIEHAIRRHPNCQSTNAAISGLERAPEDFCEPHPCHACLRMELIPRDVAYYQPLSPVLGNFRRKAPIWSYPTRSELKLCRETNSEDFKYQPRDITELSYWTRVWIVQELRLAREVIFFLGELELSPKIIRDYCNLLLLLTDDQLRSVFAPVDLMPTHIRTLINERTDTADPSYRQIDRDPKFTLDQVIGAFASDFMQCADDRDRIYGLLGLVHSDERIIVEYDLSAEMICEEVLDRITSSPTLSSTQTDYEFFSANLESLVNRLRLSPTWCRRLNLETPEQAGWAVREFVGSLWLLEHDQFVKSRWAVDEIVSIVHVMETLANEIKIIDTNRDYNRQFRKRLEFIKTLNKIDFSELSSFLSAIQGFISSRERLTSWFDAELKK